MFVCHSFGRADGQAAAQQRDELRARNTALQMQLQDQQVRAGTSAIDDAAHNCITPPYCTQPSHAHTTLSRHKQCIHVSLSCLCCVAGTS